MQHSEKPIYSVHGKGAGKQHSGNINWILKSKAYPDRQVHPTARTGPYLDTDKQMNSEVYESN